jgi:hypothetical protein
MLVNFKFKLNLSCCFKFQVGTMNVNLTVSLLT